MCSKGWDGFLDVLIACVHPTRWENTDFPASLGSGATLRPTAAVRPALFAPDARIASVVADLSDLGGPQAVPLADAGDGTWLRRKEPYDQQIQQQNLAGTLRVQPGY